MNVSLTPELDALVREKVSSGLYQSASEVIREALRLLQSQDDLRLKQQALLQADIQKGLDQLDRGEGVDFDDDAMEALIRRGESRLAKR